MPRVGFCRNDADTPAIASAMGFPLFIKTDQGFAGSGLRFALDARSLCDQTERVPCRLGTRTGREPHRPQRLDLRALRPGTSSLLVRLLHVPERPMAESILRS
jgi:hypothetical protein